MPPQAYKVKGWKDHFENNRTRDLKQMEWVPTPNRHDGDGYTELLDHPNGMAHYGAWVLILQIASKCDYAAPSCAKDAPPCERRGTLVRDGCKPHDAASLARQTRGDRKIFEEALPRLVSIGWLELVPIDGVQLTKNPAPSCGETAPRCAEVTMEGKGMERNGIEGKGDGEATPLFPPDVRIDVKPPKNPSAELKAHALLLLTYLNEKAGRRFEGWPEMLKPIIKRIAEGNPIDEIKKMIDREVGVQGGDSKWLQPSTLFGKNFYGHYSDRELPIGTPTLTKPPTAFTLSTAIQNKEKEAEAFRRKHFREHQGLSGGQYVPAGWDTEQSRAEFLKLKAEIQSLKEKFNQQAV